MYRRNLRIRTLLFIIFLFIFSGCSKKENHPPVIIGVKPSSLKAGFSSQVYLSVEAQDPDNDPLFYTWSCSCGNLSSTEGANTVWTAPDDEGACSITVVVKDSKGGSTSGSVVITVSKSAKLVISNITPNPLTITWHYDQGWSYNMQDSQFTFEETKGYYSANLTQISVNFFENSGDPLSNADCDYVGDISLSIPKNGSMKLTYRVPPICLLMWLLNYIQKGETPIVSARIGFYGKDENSIDLSIITNYNIVSVIQ